MEGARQAGGRGQALSGEWSRLGAETQWARLFNLKSMKKTLNFPTFQAASHFGGRLCQGTRNQKTMQKTLIFLMIW